LVAFLLTNSAVLSLPAADFAVTSPGGFYNINGQQPNPTLTLTRGQTYTFGINTASDHPVEIMTTGFASYNNGVENNNISNGTITFTVPMDAPNSLLYLCSIHFFGGMINIVDGGPPPDFAVTSPGGFYDINGQQPNPTITLTRGVSYRFAINAASDHPFQIVSDLSGTAYNTGVNNNNISTGVLTFAVPTNAPSILYYICSLHFFSGQINIVDPPAPPLVQILSFQVGNSNVVMKWLGTNGNGWLAIPEFSSNLVVSNWSVVPSFTNSFLSGTNTTVFNRLDPICGPNVFLRMKNVRP
jgi:hypothetical protein